MHGERFDALCIQFVRLVFHQRNQRCDHERNAGHRQRSKLVNQRLATAGWHDDKCVAAVEDRLDRLPLAMLEVGMSEALAE